MTLRGKRAMFSPRIAGEKKCYGREKTQARFEHSDSG
jgi:hypothetical protein